MRISKLLFLFLVIFLEGYVVLSAELLTIRQIIPYTGSGTDTVSIIIAAVLMPMAVGYFAGGNFKPRQNFRVRKKLLRNIMIATLFLLPGLSYLFIDIFFTTLNTNGLNDRLINTAIYATLFMVIPVYLLAQTIPLASHYLKKETLSYATGRMLFFSTLGSFMGAIFSTLVLMNYLGVHHTASITIICLCLLYILLSHKRRFANVMPMVIIAGLALIINSGKVMESQDIVENNQYNTIKILEMEHGATRILSLNNNFSSKHIDESLLANPEEDIDKVSGKYVNYINQNFIAPIRENGPVKSILVIGAGGFTVGLHDAKNDYMFIDIDDSLKDISEKYFLKRELQPNKIFEAIPARAFLKKAIHEEKQYDLIVIDAYQGNFSLPEHLVTKEFYEDVKKVTKDDGIVIGNYLLSPNFSDRLSLHVDNTLRQVFPNIGKQILRDYNGWDDNPKATANMLYIYYKKVEGHDGVYTDNKNQAAYDREKSLPAE